MFANKCWFHNIEWIRHVPKWPCFLCICLMNCRHWFDLGTIFLIPFGHLQNNMPPFQWNLAVLCNIQSHYWEMVLIRYALCCRQYKTLRSLHTLVAPLISSNCWPSKPLFTKKNVMRLDLASTIHAKYVEACHIYGHCFLVQSTMPLKSCYFFFIDELGLWLIVKAHYDDPLLGHFWV